VTGYAGVRHRVLIADDEQTNRMLLVKLLGEIGFETLEAGNGAEAIRLATAQAPSILVTDLAMPVMDGLAVARALRRDASLRHLPILAVSASASDYTREEAIQAGCNEFLAKPIRASELLASLGRLLGLTWNVEAADAPADWSAVPGATAHLAIQSHAAAELYDLAMKGEIKALIARAELAMEADPAGAPVYEELRRLARNFDLKAVRRRLEHARGVNG
jgi:CheY-like chemotaxis protein